MSSSDRRSLARIALLSVLILFLEMLLVRWVGTELRVFAYLQNGVLVAAFLGLGLGARSAREPVRYWTAAAALASVALVIRDPFRWELGEAVSQGLTAFQDSLIWSARTAYRQAHIRTALIAFAVMLSLAVLAAVVEAFRPLGQWLGRWMDESPRPVAAYTANVLGSLVGIALFVAITVAGLPPHVWLAVAVVGLLPLVPLAREGPLGRTAAALLLVGLPVLAWTGHAAATTWSPYQKLSVTPMPSTPTQPSCGETVTVNNANFQLLLDLDTARMAGLPALYPPGQVRRSHYLLPWELLGARDRVLIVGAGGGNDAAAALQAGAQQVTAVEIDPAIAAWGKDRHPNHPYQSPRVRVAIDDARAFFRRDTGPYDVAWFGLLDSHTNPSAYSNVRLDHFVYTRESFADLKRLLAPAGVVVLFFEPQTEWIGGRLAGLLRETFGAEPLAFNVRSSTPCLGWGGLLLLGGSPDALAPVRARVEADGKIARLLASPSDAGHDPVLTTDDWPYLYLQGPGIPRYHLLIGLACLVIGLVLRRRLFKPGEPANPTMILLGAGFMLLEVSGVSRAALLFGTTWRVNAYVVGAILAMILLANLTVSLRPVNVVGWPAAGLASTLLLLALVPTAWLATLPAAARVVVGGGFLALPVYFAGLVFVSLWSATERKDLALGSNLLGSLLGGVASMLSMAIGFQALTLLTLAVYGLALGLAWRGRPLVALSDSRTGSPA